jgi:hypothetical protein
MTKFERRGLDQTSRRSKEGPKLDFGPEPLQFQRISATPRSLGAPHRTPKRALTVAGLKSHPVLSPEEPGRRRPDAHLLVARVEFSPIFKSTSRRNPV